MIDWGWFYFITKPMFLALDYFFHLFGNFGVSILLVTVLIKLLFFPLANKSYASMAKMKSVQPQLAALKERYPDDRQKQQQEMMEIYRKEKINPIAGCLPIALQIPVFFSLYKVLFVTIEMRHAPFYGWIKDLSAPDPTTIFNLFGLIPCDPMVLGPVVGPYLMLGVWPIIMGITMWFQMKLNPTPPDPTQKMIFDWMPLIFTFMLARFPAGLVARPDHDFQPVRAIPWDPMMLGPVVGPYLMLGVWPIIMGITMWFQMKLNPTPPDPTQKMIFDWMPLIFTFMLARPAVVIYWAWNNLLSVLQQSYIMRKNGVKVELFDNIKATFRQEGRREDVRTRPFSRNSIEDVMPGQKREALNVPGIHVFRTATKKDVDGRDI